MYNRSCTSLNIKCNIDKHIHTHIEQWSCSFWGVVRLCIVGLWSLLTSSSSDGSWQIFSSVHYCTHPLHVRIECLRLLCMHMVACSTNKVDVHVRIWSFGSHHGSWLVVHPRPCPIDECDWNVAVQLCAHPLQQWPSGPSKGDLHVEEGILPTGKKEEQLVMKGSSSFGQIISSTCPQ